MSGRAPRLLAAALLLSSLSALPSCGAPPPKTPASDAAAEAAAKRTAPLPPVRAHMLAAVGERTLGPYFARHGDGRGALAVWVTPAEGHGRRVLGLPLTGTGEPLGGEKALANVAVDTTMLVVRTLRGTVPGFVVAWTSLNDRGESLYAVAVGNDGVPRHKPIELARTTDDVVWVEIIPTDLGAVCVWAEETRGSDANVVAASLDTDGKVRGVPARVAQGVTGWHAIEVAGGVGVSTVSTPAKAKGGTLAYQRLDLDGHASGPAVPIVSKPTVSGDVEIVRDGKRLVFAWTDRTTDEPALAAAALGEDGAVTPARRLLDVRGGAALLGLASGPAGVAALWEAPVRRGGSENRRLHLARIGADLSLEGKPALLESVGRTTPELAPTQTGFAVAAPMRDCDPGDKTTCPEAQVVASFARVDQAFTLEQREPLTFSGDPASMTWGLSCGGDACFALAASGNAPARVRAVGVNPRVNVRAQASDVTLPPKDAPRVAEVSAIATGESVTDLAVTHFGDATVLAMLASKAEGASGKGKGDGQVLSTRILDANGAASAPIVLSTRALAVGGVAIAPSDKPEDGGAVAWVARENGDPEVHVTRIDKKGKRTNDVQLTTTKGDASDVSISWAPGGWIVAWVDARDGNGEVYATKIGPDLNRISREERLTTAPGDASDLVALPRGDVVWLAWADPRESAKDGMSDIFVSAVKMRDAKRAVDETRLLATAPHSRSPHMVLAEDAVHVAWIEEAPMGIDAPGSSGHGALWASLDANGKPVGKPVTLPLGGEGAASSVAFANVPGVTGLRGVIARSTSEGIALDTVELGARPRAFPLLMLDGPASLDVALVMDGEVLFFNDDGPTAADKRARRARISWSQPAR